MSNRVEHRNWDRWVDSLVLSAVTIFSLYTKLSYGFICISFIVANTLTSKYNRRVSIISIIFIVLLIVIAEFIFGFHSHYIKDNLDIATTAAIWPRGTSGALDLIVPHSWNFFGLSGRSAVCTRIRSKKSVRTGYSQLVS